MKNLMTPLGFLLLFLCELCFAQEWVKPNAGRPEYVKDRTACVQEAQSMMLPEGAFEKDIVECLVSKGWQRNVNDKSMPDFCTKKEAAISCKAGGTEEMYKRDRADCVDQMTKTVGNTYQRPAWYGLVGLIVAGVVTQENKINLAKSQLAFMKICMEGKNWTVEWMGDAKELMGSAGGGPPPPVAPPADHPMPTSQSNPGAASTNAGAATTAKGITGESRYMIDAERLAKSTGCTAPVAAMNSRAAGAELFTVTCSTGDILSIRCDDGACRTLK